VPKSQIKAKNKTTGQEQGSRRLHRKTAWLPKKRKGSQLNAAKESKDIFERPKKQNTQTNFDKRCQSLITKQTKVFIDMVWNISPP
jgi:hypothetical protein